MSNNIKHVAVWGATGNLGPSIVDQLVQAGFDVTILSRSAELPSNVNKAAKVKQITDFSSVPDVAAALKGQDAVVSTAGASALELQANVIDAAIEAGVKFFLPSEFGSAPANKKAAALPVFQGKEAIRKHLATRADEGKIAYALVGNGPFLDWGLRIPFLLSVDGDTPSRIFDGGDVPFSATLLSDVGKTVAEILKSPDQYKNRAVEIRSAVVTQNQLLAASKKASVSGKAYPIQHEKTTEVLEQSYKDLQSGQADIQKTMVNFINVAIYSPDYGNVLPENDSKALGIKQLSEQEVDRIVADIVREKQNQ
ncbi:NAD(P)-binding protein [Myriangium duriaei CBS 260.36]|uniref:NAD(P)-binding protein n=1 Tax=Myriangium duriaei CBS 260.36 TaxID=1168546 RepID=A0A9P4IYC6_9PEZI|nr:NAD(P)-binding protein [Myriangium duriaei CBS 260.36]